MAECMLSFGREDWSRAIPMLETLVRRHPNMPSARDLLGRANYAALLSSVDGKHDAALACKPVKADIDRVEDADVYDLLMGFESIGASCEFGLVQRRFGAEPLGLLRWNIVWPEELIAALDYDLVGMGEIENTELFLSGFKEFYLLDRRWHFGMHTFMFEGQIDPAKLYERMRRRVIYLRRRFLADLAAGEKVLVYTFPGLTADIVKRLTRALRRHGPVRLLVVQPAEPKSPGEFRGRPGEIMQVEPGCLIGFLPRLGMTPDQSWDIAYDSWIALCRKAIENINLSTESPHHDNAHATA